MSDYYGRNGEPITIQQYTSGRSGEEWKAARRVTETNDGTVSTVWLGLDHSFGDGPPLVWETMVFGGGLDQYTERYTTEAEAYAGHERIVEKVRVEADAFAALAADPDVVAAVRLIQERLTGHLDAFDVSDYDGAAYARLAKAVTA